MLLAFKNKGNDMKFSLSEFFCFDEWLVYAQIELAPIQDNHLTAARSSPQAVVGMA